MITEAKDVKAFAAEKKLPIREKSERKTSQSALLLLIAAGLEHSFVANGKVAFVKVFNEDAKAKPVYDLFALTEEGTKVPVSEDDCAKLKSGSTINVKLAFNEVDEATATPAILKAAKEYDGKRGFVVFDTVTIA